MNNMKENKDQEFLNDAIFCESNCCNAKMFNDVCMDCGEHCVSVQDDEQLTQEKRVEEAEQATPLVWEDDDDYYRPEDFGL